MSDELVAIQRLIDKEHHFTYGKWQPPKFDKHIQPLVITLENHLKEAGYADSKRRREIRMEILRRITRQNITSTKDLSAYQCTTIYGFLVDKDSDSYRATEHGERLLDSITEDIESYGVVEKEQT